MSRYRWCTRRARDESLSLLPNSRRSARVKGRSYTLWPSKGWNSTRSRTCCGRSHRAAGKTDVTCHPLVALDDSQSRLRPPDLLFASRVVSWISFLGTPAIYPDRPGMTSIATRRHTAHPTYRNEFKNGKDSRAADEGRLDQAPLCLLNEHPPAAV